MASKLVLLISLLISLSANARMHIIGADVSFLFGGGFAASYKTNLNDYVLVGAGFDINSDLEEGRIEYDYTFVYVGAELWIKGILKKGWSTGMVLGQSSGTFRYKTNDGTNLEETSTQLFPIIHAKYNWIFGDWLMSAGMQRSLITEKTVSFSYGLEDEESSSFYDFTGPILEMQYSF